MSKKPISEAPLLEVKNVTKRFPVYSGALRRRVGSIHAVTDVSLSIQPGQIVGLVGESGSGKTTLARMIIGLEIPTAGTIHKPGSGPDVQLVFQDPTSSLDPRQRVGAALAEPLQVHRLVTGTAARERAVTRLLDDVGLPAHYARRFPRELSGGERQRVAIARALAVQPKLVIMDEPVASLDVYVGAQILELLRRLHRDKQLSYLVISHDLRVIGSLCDVVAVMYLGRLVEWAPAAQLFREPHHPYTELLLDAAGLREQGVPDRGEPPSPLNPPSGCVFRTRCPLAQPVCAEQHPPLEAKRPNRLVACHFRP